QAAISGALAAAIVIAWAVAVLLGRVHVYQYVLGAVLLALNLARLAASLSAIRKFRRIPRSIESARAGVHAAAESGPDRARWN
ncbi:MAG: hypothetical protein J2P34_05060, partial [Actinobacteria bacterium]|nr:hypothetical protein [Actinomycetota bacterium]